MVAKKRFFVPSDSLRELESTHVKSELSKELALFVPDDEDDEKKSNFSSSNIEPRQPETINVDSDDETKPKTSQSNLKQPTSYPAFEKSIISILGSIPSKKIRQLYSAFALQKDPVSLAIDRYFSEAEGPKTPTNDQEPTVEKKKHIQLPLTSLGANRSNVQTETSPGPKDSPKRHIGSLTVYAWATRPTMRPLSRFQKLQLKRLIPRKLTGVKKSPSKFGDTAVIRLFTVPGLPNVDVREIGRLPEDMTRIFAPLLDLEVACFDVTVVLETTRRLSVGDSFCVQLDCFLTEHAFEPFSSLDNGLSKRRKIDQSTRFNFATETEAEAVLRLRQTSISRLFDKLGLLPFFSDDEEIDSEEPNSSQLLSTGTDQLSLDQLKQFYKSNQHSKLLDSLPSTTRPSFSNFQVELRKYQRHGLSWMLARENELGLLEQLSLLEMGDVLSTQSKETIQQSNDGIMNPLWKSFKWPPDRSVSKSSSVPQMLSGEYFYANLYSGELSMAKPMIKNAVRGGILADEMGLGKTISALALVSACPYDMEADQSEGSLDTRNYASHTTLVVVPMSLLTQWQKEFQKVNANKNHKCLIYYGDQTSVNLSTKLCNIRKEIPVVILTTYGTLLNEYQSIVSRAIEVEGKQQLPREGLFSVKFFRVILDEGHNIRNRTAKTSKAVYSLRLSRRWVLTGTPVINRLDDMYSLVKFLELEPWSNFSYWKTFVTEPFEQRKIKQTIDVVKSILDPILLRRTKNMRVDGELLVELPEKEVSIQEVTFNERERQLYDWFRVRASKIFKEGLKSGDLLRRYTQILTQILRLRQICCHMDLVGSLQQDFDEEVANGADDVKSELDQFNQTARPEQQDLFKTETEVKEALYPLYESFNLETSECSICTQSPISTGELSLTTCGHTFCLKCILEHIAFQQRLSQPVKCPNCRSPISKHKLFKLRNRVTTKKDILFHNPTLTITKDQFDYEIFHYDPDNGSSKIQALILHLQQIQEQSPGERVVVFSQFSSYLDLIENELKVQGSDIFHVVKFDGRLKMQERNQLIESFNNDDTSPRVSILLLSLKAGGVGLNLTSASRAFMMDPWWSPSVEDQAIDRIHRIGQVRNVKVTRFIIQESIEEKMLKIQERKKQIGEAVGADEQERQKRRIEEIQILFED